MFRAVSISANYKHLLFLGLFYGAALSSIFGQSTITTTQFLHTVNTTIQNESDSIVALLTDYNYNLPLIRGVQFRTETKDLRLKRQEYALRIKPNSLRTIKNQNKINQNKIEKVKIENELSFNKDLENRYYLIVNFIFTDKLIVLLERKQNQLKDKLKILAKQIYDTNFDIKDLIDTEESLQEVELKLLNLNKVNKV